MHKPPYGKYLAVKPVYKKGKLWSFQDIKPKAMQVHWFHGY